VTLPGWFVSGYATAENIFSNSTGNDSAPDNSTVPTSSGYMFDRCPANTFNNGGNLATSCTACPNGTVTRFDPSWGYSYMYYPGYSASNTEDMCGTCSKLLLVNMCMVASCYLPEFTCKHVACQHATDAEGHGCSMRHEYFILSSCSGSVLHCSRFNVSSYSSPCVCSVLHALVLHVLMQWLCHVADCTLHLHQCTSRMSGCKVLCYSTCKQHLTGMSAGRLIPQLSKYQ
jgi:hypothetical protein